MVGNRMFRTRTGGRPGGFAACTESERTVPPRVPPCPLLACLLAWTWRNTCVTSGSSETSTAWWKPGRKHSLQPHEDAFSKVGSTGNVVSRPGNRVPTRGMRVRPFDARGMEPADNNILNTTHHTLASSQDTTPPDGPPPARTWRVSKWKHQVTQCPHR